jgi:hypothetical protein
LTRIFVIAALIVSTNSFSLERRRFPGIWKLTSKSLPFEQDIRSKLNGLLSDGPKEEILIKLNPDGSFKQCNEGFTGGRWMSGHWKLSEEKTLILAMRRQYYGPQFDVMLEGNIQEEGQLKVEGQVRKGRFMYPQTHPSFFDKPLVNQEPLGPFTLEQSLATNSILVSLEEDPISENKFQPSIFYGRSFIMTIEPIQPKERKDIESVILPVDIRAMPIQFFHNNTFQAFATNKILRGRFHITKDDKLTFDVSLFGAGRSMPGSVFSVGLGLTHEDERGYLGSIEESNGRLYVEGTVTFGSDLGTDARPEPVGTFLLTETKDAALSVDEDEDDETFDSMFE